jgi:hypothetical protein
MCYRSAVLKSPGNSRVGMTPTSTIRSSQAVEEDMLADRK